MIPPDEVLPCGCLLRCGIQKGVNTLTYIPCKTSCQNYLDAMGYAKKKNVPVQYKEAP